MNYPAASSGVSSKALNAPRGGEYNPCPPLADLMGFKYFYLLDGFSYNMKKGNDKIRIVLLIDKSVLEPTSHLTFYRLQGTGKNLSCLWKKISSFTYRNGI